MRSTLFHRQTGNSTDSTDDHSIKKIHRVEPLMHGSEQSQVFIFRFPQSRNLFPTIFDWLELANKSVKIHWQVGEFE